MGATRFQAACYLGYRALFAHPVRRLRLHGTGLQRFVGNYEGEGLYRTSPADHALAEAASACISCGLCETGCELLEATPSVRDLGLVGVFRLSSKSTAEMRHAAEALTACATCSGCEQLCPTGVPIGRVIRGLLERVVPQRGPSGLSPRSPSEAHSSARLP